MNNEKNQPIENLEEEIVAEEMETVEEAAPKKVRSADKIRRLRHGRLATLITVGVIVATLLLNVVFSIIGSRFPLNLDLTSKKLFSLSEESTAIAQSLTEPVEIVVFTSEAVFSDIRSEESMAFHGGQTSLATVLSQFYNATRQYNQLTGGKVTTTYIDMNRNPTAVSKYSEYKEDAAIADGDILFISDKQSRVSNIGEGLFTYDPSEYYSSGGVLNIESIVEQTLATNLKAVQSATEQVITFATGHDEDTNVLTALQDLYNLNGYTIESVNLTRSTAINPNTVCMVIPAPTKDYSTETIQKLRDWLSNGGKEGRNLMVYVHPTSDCPNLYEFLKVDYGMEVTNNVVAESNLDLMYQSGPFYPFGTIASTDYTASCGGGDALFPLCRQIIPHWEAQTEESVQYSVNLMTFSETAQLAPMEAITTNAVPDLKDYKDTIVGMAVAVKEGYQNALQAATTTKVGVCGSAYAANFVSMNTVDNELLFLDSMTKISGVTNTVNISSKSLAEESIYFAPSVVIIVGRIIFASVLPLGLLAFGLFMFLRRRHL